MPVVRHDGPGEQIDTVAPQRLRETIQESPVILRLSEDLHLPVASIQNVVDCVGNDLTERTRHEGEV